MRPGFPRLQRTLKQLDGMVPVSGLNPECFYDEAQKSKSQAHLDRFGLATSTIDAWLALHR